MICSAHFRLPHLAHWRRRTCVVFAKRTYVSGHVFIFITRSPKPSLPKTTRATQKRQQKTIINNDAIQIRRKECGQNRPPPHRLNDDLVHRMLADRRTALQAGRQPLCSGPQHNRAKPDRTFKSNGVLVRNMDGPVRNVSRVVFSCSALSLSLSPNQIPKTAPICAGSHNENRITPAAARKYCGHANSGERRVHKQPDIMNTSHMHADNVCGLWSPSPLWVA